MFDLCCSHWRLIFLPHQIRPEVHHELQILPNTKLGDKNWSPPDQILRRMGYICPRPWRGLVKLNISWISNTKRNFHRSENEPLTDSYHEHFYVEKGFKVSDVLIQNLRCLKVWKFWSHRSWSNWSQWGKKMGLRILKTILAILYHQAQIKLGQSIYHTLDRATDPCRPGSVTHCKEKCRLVES